MSIAAACPSNPGFHRQRGVYRLAAAFLIVLLAMVIGFDLYVYGLDQGGQGSEKLISRSGVADSNKVIEMSGVSGSLEIATGTTVTATASSITASTATLVGNLSSLGIFPSSTVYFQWGYAAGALANTTTSQTKSATGSFTAAITFDPAQPAVFYRAVSVTDSTVYSSTGTFAPTMYAAHAGRSVSFNLLLIVIPVIVLVSVLLFGVMSIQGLLFCLIGVLGIILAQYLIFAIW